MAGFQTITPVKLGQVSVGNSNTLVYTVPANTRTYLKDIDIANNTTAPIAVAVYIGTGVLASNILVPNVFLPANSIFQWTGTQILNAGDTIQAVASQTGCSLSASGGEAV